LSATCFHVELEQFFTCIRVARVCQRQLGILVTNSDAIALSKTVNDHKNVDKNRKSSTDTANSSTR